MTTSLSIVFLVMDPKSECELRAVLLLEPANNFCFTFYFCVIQRAVQCTRYIRSECEDSPQGRPDLWGIVFVLTIAILHNNKSNTAVTACKHGKRQEHDEQ